MSFIFSSILKKSPIHLVFFPGTGCTGHIFQKVAQYFSPKQVVFHYEPTSNGYNLEAISSACLARLRKSIGNEMAMAVGHSLGGVTAAMTVNAAPELFRGLVLCNTRYRPVNILERQAKNAIIKKISHCTEEQFDKLLSSSFFKNQEELLTEEEIRLLIKDMRATGKQAFLQQIKLSLEEISPDYQQILDHLPITVIQGIDDTVIPNPEWDESGLQDSPTKYQLKLIKCSGGHLSILKHPILIADQIKNIIAENNPQDLSLVSRPF